MESAKKKQPSITIKSYKNNIFPMVKNAKREKLAHQKLFNFPKYTQVLDKNDANNPSLNLKIIFNGVLR